MREIKFRAWDKEEKKMVTNTNICSLLFNRTGTCCRLLTWEDKKYYENEFILMQFTGLHDKNGKEIWEGDVVAVKSFYIGDSYIPAASGEIKYGNGSFYIDSEFAPELCEEEISNESIEVIGNTYENNVLDIIREFTKEKEKK